MECHVLSWLTSKGPRSGSICTGNLPWKSDGTRHEYRQAPRQPYWNLSATSTGVGLPALLISLQQGRSEPAKRFRPHAGGAIRNRNTSARGVKNTNGMAQRGLVIPACSLRDGGVSRYRLCQGWSCLTSMGPRSMPTWTWNLPVKSFGTRHEYRQVPPQPYWKLPWAITWPASLTIRTVGADSAFPFFLTTGW